MCIDVNTASMTIAVTDRIVGHLNSPKLVISTMAENLNSIAAATFHTHKLAVGAFTTQTCT
jgi:hypothetical protein